MKSLGIESTKSLAAHRKTRKSASRLLYEKYITFATLKT